MQRTSLRYLLQFLWLLYVTCFGSSLAVGQTDPGSIDHVRVLVHDFDASRKVYRDVLGFDLQAQPILYQEGSAHDWTDLGDSGYVELIGIVDREKLLKVRPWIVEFLQFHQGPQSVGLLVPSAHNISQNLQSRGIEAPIFSLTRDEPGDKPVLLVTPKLPHVPDGAIFFLEYPPSVTPIAPNEPIHQPNSAEKIVAVWIVVNDLKKASEDVQTLGFRSVRSLRSRALGADGREFAADRGSIVLLEAKGEGPVSRFTRERGGGVMGFTLSVADLSKARTLIQKNAKRHVHTYRGFYGSSFLIPAEIAAGAWIEMVQE